MVVIASKNNDEGLVCQNTRGWRLDDRVEQIRKGKLAT